MVYCRLISQIGSQQKMSFSRCNILFRLTPWSCTFSTINVYSHDFLFCCFELLLAKQISTKLFWTWIRDFFFGCSTVEHCAALVGACTHSLLLGYFQRSCVPGWTQCRKITSHCSENIVPIPCWCISWVPSMDNVYIREFYIHCDTHYCHAFLCNQPLLKIYL